MGELEESKALRLSDKTLPASESDDALMLRGTPSLLDRRGELLLRALAHLAVDEREQARAELQQVIRSIDEELPVTETASHGLARAQGLHARAEKLMLAVEMLAVPGGLLQATALVAKLFELPHRAVASTPTGEFAQLIGKVFRNLDMLLPALYAGILPAVVECVVAGKIRGARAKSMKFTDGYMIKSGDPKRQYVDSAVRHVALRQGMLGVRVTIMLPWDPTGKTGPKNPLPDQVVIHDPKEDLVMAPTGSLDPTKGEKGM